MKEERCFSCMKMKETGGICPYCGAENSVRNEDHQLPAGTILKEQYLIGKVLGQGGFGITYIGWDRYLEIPVAIKEYFPSGAVSRNCKTSTEVVSGSGEVGARFRNSRERFLREVKMLARLSDIPEIVQVKTFFLENNTAYIVMEYIEGINLKEYVEQKGGRLDFQETLDLLGPVIKALEKVHRAGVVHRDISPDNIMLQKNGSVKLLDFGAVRDVGIVSPDKPLSQSTEAILKQGYAPVEQYQNKGSLGPWTDVYAMCATMYFCLMGKVPVDAPSRMLGDQMEWFEDAGLSIPACVSETIQKGMELRVQDRIKNMGELYQRLSGEALYDPDADDITEPGDISEPDDIREADNVQERDDGHVRDDDLEPDDASDRKADPKTEAGSDSGTVRKTDMNPERDVSEPDEEGTEKRNSRIWKTAVAGLLVIAVGAGAWALRPGKEDKSAASDTVLTQEAEPTAEPTSQEEEATVEPTVEPTPEPEILTGECGENLSYELNCDTGVLTLTAGEGQEGVMTDFADTPDETVEPRCPWREQRDLIRKVVISENVTVIGEIAFDNCQGLTEVEGWEHLKEIHTRAFRGCTGISEAELPEGLTLIGVCAFEGCTNLKEIVIPSTAEEVGAGAFYNTPLGKITFKGNPSLDEHVEYEDVRMNIFFDVNGDVPEGLRIYGLTGSEVEDLALAYRIPFVSQGYVSGYELSGQCGDDVYWELDYDTGVLTLTGTGATWGYLGSTMSRTGDDDRIDGWPKWHEYRNHIKKLVIGPEITALRDSLFEGCRNLTEVEWGNVEEIYTNAFADTGLVSVAFPDSLTELVDYSMQACENLVEVTIPEGTQMLRVPFAGCTALKKVTILGSPSFEANPDGTQSIFEYDDDGSGKSEDLVLYAYEDSSAKAYAAEYGIPFVALEREEE